MLVFGGEGSEAISGEVSRALNSESGGLEIRDFPDGEKYVRVMPNVSGSECALIKSVRSNDDLMELLLCLDALRDQGAAPIHAVTPYLAYMRQDKRFKPGEALSAKTVLKLIHEFADTTATINCHFLSDAGEAVHEGIRFHNLDAISQLAGHIGLDCENPVFIAPDKGSLGFAKQGAHLMDCGFNHLTKTRHSGTEVEIGYKELEVEGKDVIILDDIISTGGTIVEAAKMIRRWKPKTVNVGCVHGLFLNGVEKLGDVVDNVVATDTVGNPVAKVKVSNIIAEHLMRL
jgi:ribose-phosphate pyrophosphokinase